jgi:hypothetical protein
MVGLKLELFPDVFKVKLGTIVNLFFDVSTAIFVERTHQPPDHKNRADMTKTPIECPAREGRFKGKDISDSAQLVMALYPSVHSARGKIG